MLVRFTFEDGKQEYFPVQKIGVEQGTLLWYKEEDKLRRDVCRKEFWERRPSLKSVEVDFFFKGNVSATALRTELMKSKKTRRARKDGQPSKEAFGI